MLVLDHLSRIPAFGPQVPPASSLVVLLSLTYTLTYQGGRVVNQEKVREILMGFQIASMAMEVMTAGHCIQSVDLEQSGLVQREASEIYAVPFTTWQYLQPSQWFDIITLEKAGAQKVLSWQSDFPSSGQQLKDWLNGNPTSMAEHDAAILKLSGPLRGVVGLAPAASTTRFRIGAPFLSFGLPDELEDLGQPTPNIPQTAIYSCYQDSRAPVTLSADSRTFTLSSVVMPGFSGGPLCAREKDIIAPTLLDALALLIKPFSPSKEAPKQQPCPPTTRQGGDTITAVDPATGEALAYPTGEHMPLAAV
jgi:hypothetical protein